MPKNLRGGRNHKKSKNKRSDPVETDLILRMEGQEYAQVTKMLGSCRVEAYCFNSGCSRTCTIRGALRKKRVYINLGDIILISLREFATENNKADVIGKYTTEHSRELKKLGELPKNVNVSAIGSKSAIDNEDEDDCAFDFDNL